MITALPGSHIVSVGETAWNRSEYKFCGFGNVSTDDWMTFKCHGPVNGQYVAIERVGFSTLALCEVEVLAGEY